MAVTSGVVTSSVRSQAAAKVTVWRESPAAESTRVKS